MSQIRLGIRSTSAAVDVSTWLGPDLHDDAEQGGGLQVAIVQFAIAVGASGGRTPFASNVDLRSYRRGTHPVLRLLLFCQVNHAWCDRWIMIMAANKTRHSDDLHSGKSGDTHPGSNKGKEPQKADGEATKGTGEAKTPAKTPSSKCRVQPR
jgi:hypothetical protein